MVNVRMEYVVMRITLNLKRKTRAQPKIDLILSKNSIQRSSDRNRKKMLDLSHYIAIIMIMNAI